MSFHVKDNHCPSILLHEKCLSLEILWVRFHWARDVEELTLSYRIDIGFDFGKESLEENERKVGFGHMLEGVAMPYL